jgi:hypothetical protein
VIRLSCVFRGHNWKPGQNTDELVCQRCGQTTTMADHGGRKEEAAKPPFRNEGQV